MYPFTALLLPLCSVTAALVLGTTESRIPYSQWMLDNIMSRKQGLAPTYDRNSTLEAGILALALERTIAQYPETSPKYSQYLQVVFAAASLLPRDVNVNAILPLDRFSVSYVIDRAVKLGAVNLIGHIEEAYDAIRDSFQLQPFDQLEGYLYDATYPEMTSIEGAFSLLPYMATELAKLADWGPANQLADSEAQQEGDRLHHNLVKQLHVMHANAIDPATGLPAHGYNATRNATWTEMDNGRSPFVWGRSLGLRFMGVAETWEVLQCSSEKMRIQDKSFNDMAKICLGLKEVARPIVSALVEYADPNTGAWRQLTTVEEEGNFLESSSTALFVAGILMSQRIGLVPKETHFKEAALRAFEYTVNNFITDTGNGTIGFNQTVAGCSLDATASAEYYLSRPIIPNNLLGEAAFVLAALEVEKEWMSD